MGRRRLTCQRKRMTSRSRRERATKYLSNSSYFGNEENQEVATSGEPTSLSVQQFSGSGMRDSIPFGTPLQQQSSSSTRHANRCSEASHCRTPVGFIPVAPERTPLTPKNCNSPNTPSSIHCVIPQKTYKSSSEGTVRGKRRLDMGYLDTPAKRHRLSLDTQCHEAKRISNQPAQSESSRIIEGRRIVDLDHLITELQRLFKHSTTCAFEGGEMKLIGETRKGLVSFLTYRCSECKQEEKVRTDPHTDLRLNTGLVFGTLSVGMGRSQVQEFLANIDVPSLTPRNFSMREREVAKIWDKKLAEEMEVAMEEEKQLATEENRVDSEGRPFITVIVDGGWAIRSYRHSFKSNSGLAVIIGARTGKLLYLGIKNRFCFVCAKRKDGEGVPDHRCNKNFKGAPTAMEQSIILEGLQYMLSAKNMYPEYVIGDGDSSVYAKIKQGLRGVGPKVKKVECSNHVRKNYRKKLHGLVENTQKSKVGRDMLKPRLHRLVKALSCAIKRNVGNVPQMVKDLKNGPHHVFGDHTNCDTARYCTRKETNEPNVFSEFEETGFMDDIRGYVDMVVRLAPRLVTNATTNPAESMMAKVAKFTGGKRIDFCKGNSFATRCKGAGLSQLLGPSFMLKTWASHYSDSPGVVAERVLRRKYCIMDKRRTAFRAAKAAGKNTCEGRYGKKNHVAQHDSDYGPNAAQPDLNPDELEAEMLKIQESNRARVLSDEDRANLEVKTRGQASNADWVEVRHWLLTASDFGDIVNRREDTSCHSYLKNRVNSKNLDNNDAIVYGRLSEEYCRLCYEEKTGEKVVECGIFVEPQFPYLGASPDGLVGNDGCFEAKALFCIKTKALREALNDSQIVKKHNLCYDLEENWSQRGVRKDRRAPVDPNGKLILKPTHKYWFQVQGQMALTRRKWCDLVLRTDKSLEIIRVDFDQDTWEDIMKPRLQKFYENCLLPELADSRILRGLRARDPPYIQEAQRVKEEKRAEAQRLAEAKKAAAQLLNEAEEEAALLSVLENAEQADREAHTAMKESKKKKLKVPRRSIREKSKKVQSQNSKLLANKRK